MVAGIHPRSTENTRREQKIFCLSRCQRAMRESPFVGGSERVLAAFSTRISAAPQNVHRASRLGTCGKRVRSAKWNQSL
jgi:hypothetical protein